MTENFCDKCDNLIHTRYHPLYKCKVKFPDYFYLWSIKECDKHTKYKSVKFKIKLLEKYL